MTSMRIPWVISGVARSPRDLQDAMDATTAVSVKQLRRYGIPPLALSGVVYERERRRHPMPGVERFQTALDAWCLGHADCDGLAPWRAAELVVSGVPARARVVSSRGIGYHVIVERGDSIDGGPRIEDPSAELGMLDGVGQYDDDAVVSASKRRRARGRAFLGQALALAKRAGAGVTAPQRMALAQSLAAAQHADALLSRSGPIPVPAPNDDDEDEA